MEEDKITVCVCVSVCVWGEEVLRLEDDIEGRSMEEGVF